MFTIGELNLSHSLSLKNLELKIHALRYSLVPKPLAVHTLLAFPANGRMAVYRAFVYIADLARSLFTQPTSFLNVIYIFRLCD